MKVEFWLIGKTKDPWVSEAIAHYIKRCSRYCTLTTEIIQESRHSDPEEMRRDETTRVIAKLRKAQKGFTLLLDERGKQLSSMQLSQLIGTQQSAGMSSVRFIVGGAFGVENILHQEVDYVLSLSMMTFPHQLVRVIFLEQLYRAFTILRGEGYHHD